MPASFEEQAELATELLTVKGLLLIYGPILRESDLKGALRRVAIVLSLYKYDISLETLKDGTQGFTLANWLDIFDLEIQKSRQKSYQFISAIELFQILAESLNNVDERVINLGKNFMDKDPHSIIPFDTTNKTLNNDFNAFVEGEWIERLQQGRNNYYQQLPISDLPIFTGSQQSKFLLNLTSDRLQILSEYLVVLAFMEPEFGAMANDIYNEGVNVARTHIHLDYVVPESHDLGDTVDGNHSFLRENTWNSSLDIPLPISFEYSSASTGKELECLVYPVCIYYFQRAKYLCAWGYKQGTGVTWHNYRLDRIKSSSLKTIDWQSDDIPDAMKQAYDLQELPEPKDIQQKMTEAWGFDFYQDPVTLILRFDRKYHDKYIAESFRHQTFKRMPKLENVQRLLKEEVTDNDTLSFLNDRVDRHPEDAYYRAKVRLGDNNIIMRLRAWGDKVEVLSPQIVRDRMIGDIKNTLNAYEH
jgi:CRISPR-associated protein (TIGR03985 family)